MGFIEALLLVSINFGDGMRSISEADILQEFNNQTVVERPVYSEPVNVSSPSETNIYRWDVPRRFPMYKDSAEPVFEQGEGTEFSISWEHTVDVSGDERDELLKPFYKQLSEKMGCEINRRTSFEGCGASGGYGYLKSWKCQLYRDAKVFGCIVLENIEEGQLKSISGNFDAKIAEVPYLEPQITNEEAEGALIEKYHIDLNQHAVQSEGLWIDREYNSPVRSDNKLYYLFQVYNYQEGSKWFAVDAQEPVAMEFWEDPHKTYCNCKENKEEK